MTRLELYATAAGPGAGLPITHGAQAEILHRDRVYADDQERSRRDFEQNLAQQKMDRAAALAREQLNTAQAAATAAKMAAWAAGVAALGAIAQAVIAIVK